MVTFVLICNNRNGPGVESFPPFIRYRTSATSLCLTLILVSVPSNVVGRQQSSSGTLPILLYPHSSPPLSSTSGFGSRRRDSNARGIDAPRFKEDLARRSEEMGVVWSQYQRSFRWGGGWAMPILGSSSGVAKVSGGAEEEGRTNSGR